MSQVENKKTQEDLSGEVITVQRELSNTLEKVVYFVGIITSLFHLWVNTVGIMPEIQRNALHYSFLLFLGYLLYPMSKKHPEKTLKIDIILAVLSFLVGVYLVLFENALHARNEVPILPDLIAAAIAIVLLIEITRRTSGLVIPILAAFFLGYALYFGKYFSGLWNFPGVNIQRLLYRMYFAPDGIFGTIATISSTFVFLFVLFGAFLIKSGAGDFIIKLAVAIMGRSIGGPAKMAVFASGLMGSVSGSAVANTVGTGSITIPMMKKTGFSPKFAAAVEAAASTGGQLMPPIMGAGAFIMSQWTQIPYLKIVAVSFIPAIMYFLTVAFFVHLRAKKIGLKPLPKEEIPKISEVLKEGWQFFIPIIVLMGFLMYGYTPTYSACAGIAAIVVSSWFNKKTRMGIKDILDGLALGAKNMVTTGIILLCSGIVIGIVLLVGMGIKFSMLIQSLSGGSVLLTIIFIALASLILGMGLPVTASYIVLAVLAAPALTMLGVSLLAAHMVIFWYSQDANVTPPVCLAAYSAAGIAGSKPLETGFEAWKLAKGLYIIPLLFVYTPLLFEGPIINVIETVISATLGLYAFVVFFEGYQLRQLNIIERIIFGVVAYLLLFPHRFLTIIGFAGFIALILLQKFTIKRAENAG
ncbi:TRAP-type transport system, permease component [Deferribacter desulfuricans SSM1]|uniref:TRAP-type transport system, permease component n=1 Tax=Deferribacter desulfuricans (strain DSM 14783 / JCM 11476 / NBRC 101012 / SSM1) TaxID=639282 RepID=D3PE37_DEFDS|nr:TRAP transporter permease [Deferribacter desulfuricans]BAI80860.1 TRAP-type transport system, permease component [Deferribacter desulfuricans SSM1]